MKCSTARKSFDELFMAEGDHPALAHLQGCLQCSREYERWCAIASRLVEAPSIPTPPGLFLRVMDAVREEFFRRERRSSGVSWAAGLSWSAALMAFAVVAVLLHSMHGAPVSPPVVRQIRFEVRFPGAHSVAIAGDFNRWDAQQYQLRKAGDDTWEIDIALESGTYQYQFVVNGRDWRPDPANGLLVPDGFGGFNSGMEI